MAICLDVKVHRRAVGIRATGTRTALARFDLYFHVIVAVVNFLVVGAIVRKRNLLTIDGDISLAMI